MGQGICETDDLRPERRLGKRLFIVFLNRTVIYTAHRIVYPFLPAIARGLGISLQAASGLVTLRFLSGMAAPVLGPMADRYGHRRITEIALLLFALASLLLASIGTFTAAVVAFAVYGVSKALYDPAVFAYLGDMVPYGERARAIGLVELSWATAWLLGVPASGILIEYLGWRSPWGILIVAGLFGAWVTRRGLPRADQPDASGHNAPLAVAITGTWRSLLRRRSVVVLLVTTFLLILANEVTFIVYGAWLETAFGLSLSTLGLASIVVGLAAIAAELGTAVITDRLGKRRSVLIGLVGLAASLVALPWLSDIGLVTALVGVVLMELTFEFSIVSLLPLATELYPEARASLLSLDVTAKNLGRIVGAVAGGWLWHWQSIVVHAAVGASCALLAAFVLAWGMVEIRDQPSHHS